MLLLNIFLFLFCFSNIILMKEILQLNNIDCSIDNKIDTIPMYDDHTQKKKNIYKS